MKTTDLIKILKKQRKSIVILGEHPDKEVTVRFQLTSEGQWIIVLEPKDNSNPNNPNNATE